MSVRSTRGRGASAAEAEGGVEDVCGAAARERGFPGTHADTRLWVGRVTGASPCLQSSKHGLPPCVPRLLRAACRRCLSRCARQLRPTASLAAPDRFTALRLRSVCFKPHRSELDGRPHDATLARTVSLRQSRVDRLASSDFDKMETSLCVLMLSCDPLAGGAHENEAASCRRHHSVPGCRFLGTPGVRLGNTCLPFPAHADLRGPSNACC